MSQEDLETVGRAISAINERDVEAYLSVCNSEVELIVPTSAIEGPYRGEQGIRSYFAEISEGAARFELEIERLEPLDGDRVLGSLILHLESDGGFPQRLPLTTMYELHGGRLSRVTVFSDRAEALEAAGLSD